VLLYPTLFARIERAGGGIPRIPEKSRGISAAGFLIRNICHLARACPAWPAVGRSVRPAICALEKVIRTRAEGPGGDSGARRLCSFLSSFPAHAPGGAGRGGAVQRALRSQYERAERVRCPLVSASVLPFSGQPQTAVLGVADVGPGKHHVTGSTSQITVPDRPRSVAGDRTAPTRRAETARETTRETTREAERRLRTCCRQSGRPARASGSAWGPSDVGREMWAPGFVRAAIPSAPIQGYGRLYLAVPRTVIGELHPYLLHSRCLGRPRTFLPFPCDPVGSLRGNILT